MSILDTTLDSSIQKVSQEAFREAQVWVREHLATPSTGNLRGIPNRGYLSRTQWKDQRGIWAVTTATREGGKIIIKSSSKTRPIQLIRCPRPGRDSYDMHNGMIWVQGACEVRFVDYDGKFLGTARGLKPARLYRINDLIDKMTSL